MPPVARIIAAFIWLALPAVAAAQPATLPWPGPPQTQTSGAPPLRHSPYRSDNPVRAAEWADRTAPMEEVRPASLDEPAPVPSESVRPLPLPGTRPAARPVPLASPPPSTADAEVPRGTPLPSLVTLAGSLSVVLAAFFVVVWLMRRAAPPGTALLPTEVIEILGRAPLSGRQQMHLLRCGRKLLLVSVTPEGAEPLTEITDPLEVDRLAGLCAAARPSSATAAFRQVFQQFAAGEAHDG